jgi:hypothetical protein
LRRVVWYKFTGVSEVFTAFIIAVMEAARTSETSVNFCHTTRRNIPEDSLDGTYYRCGGKEKNNVKFYFIIVGEEATCKPWS